MQCKKRQSSYQNSILLRSSQPQLKKKPYTCSEKSVSMSVMQLRTNPQKQLYEYVKLAVKSLSTNYPVSELKPFSTFCTIQKIQQNMKDDENFFRRTNLKKRHTLYNNILSEPAQKKYSLNTTFYQTKRQKYKNSKARFKTLTHFKQFTRPDDQGHMVNQFIKQNKQLMLTQKTAFQMFNQKIKQQFPHHFEPGSNHQESKCKSKSCSQGFFKRKKYKVQQKYDLDQPGYSKPKVGKENHKKGMSQNLNFSLFSRSRNRIINIQKKKEQRQQNNELPTKINSMNMSIVQKTKFQNQSATFYKKYMRSSFYDKKKALMQNMKIKFQ